MLQANPNSGRMDVRVIRPFYQAGQLRGIGERLEVSTAFGRELIATGKALPAAAAIAAGEGEPVIAAAEGQAKAVKTKKTAPEAPAATSSNW